MKKIKSVCVYCASSSKINPRYFEAARLVRFTITEHKQIQKDALTSALRIAEDEGDDSEALRLRQALNELIKEIPRAKR